MLCYTPVIVNGERDHLVPTKSKGIHNNHFISAKHLKNISSLSWFNWHIIKCILLKFIGWKVLKNIFMYAISTPVKIQNISTFQFPRTFFVVSYAIPPSLQAATAVVSAPVDSGWSKPSQKWSCSGHSSQSHIFAVVVVDHYCLFS